MGRKSLKEARRTEIVRVFYRVAKKEGLENVSIAKIAKVMDINPSLIMHYFRTKEDLVSSLIDFLLDRWLKIFDRNALEKPASEEALLEMINSLFSRKWNALFDDRVSYSCYALIFRNKKIRIRYKSVLDSLHQTLARFIEKCRKEQILETDDPVFASRIIFALVDGAYYYLSLEDDKTEYQLRLDQYKQRAISVLGLRRLHPEEEGPVTTQKDQS